MLTLGIIINTEIGGFVSRIKNHLTGDKEKA